MYLMSDSSSCSVAALCSRPGTGCRLGRGGGNRLGCRITQAQENASGFGGLAFAQFAERSAKGFHAEVFIAGGALHAVDKGADVDEFGAVFHEIKIQNLLTGHNEMNVSASARFSTVV